MGFSNDSISNSNFKHTHHFQSEHRPKMLKDFLLDDSNLSFPKTPTDDFTIATLISKDLNQGKKLLKPRATSAFQAMVNSIKNNFRFAAVKSPSILPKSLSRKLSKNSSSSSREINSQNKLLESETKITVTIKDIIRWKSFRDLVEEKSPPSGLSFSPNHCTTTTITGSTCSSNGSSWCDSDFTSEYLPFWNSNSDGYCVNDAFEMGKINLPCVGEDSMEATTTTEKKTKTKVGPKVEEKQHNSPVSVIDIEFEEDEEYSSLCFDQSLATMQRKKQKIMQKIQRFENLARIEPVNLEKWMSMEENSNSGEYEEEKKTNTRNEEQEQEWQLLNHIVKETSSLRDYKDINLERLLFDFFREEPGRKRYQAENYGIESEILSTVKSWLCGENKRLNIKWDNREACIRDMDREGKWNKLEEEQEEVAMAIENGMMGLLLDELLLDIIHLRFGLELES